MSRLLSLVDAGGIPAWVLELQETPLCSEQPRGQTFLSSGPLETASVWSQQGPRDLPETPMAVAGGQSLGLLLVMARGFWVTRYIMGKASILSGHDGDPNVLTSLSSDPHTLPTFLQCPPPHRQVPRY